MDLAGELVVALLVIVGDRRLAVEADIRAFVGREEIGLRAVDPTFGDLLTIDEDRTLAALADAAAVVSEFVADRRLALGEPRDLYQLSFGLSGFRSGNA